MDAELRELARNLYWTWHPEVVEVFRDLDPELWRSVNHNPVAFLEQLARETIEEKGETLALEPRVAHAFHGLRAFLASEDTWGARHAGPLRAAPVAYFSAEFGIHESLPIYSGGLGVLAGDHLKAASDLDIPIVGVGLFYGQGYFAQSLDENGWQQERPVHSDPEKLPLERATHPDGTPVTVTVATRGGDINAAVWSARVGSARLVLLDTNVSENDESTRNLTAQLYGGDNGVRIRQELVLGVGGMRALDALGIRPGVVHLNEGHSAFAVLELARRYMERDGRAFREVREKIANHTVFTTHTPVAAGHDRFPPDLAEHALGPLRDAIGLGHHSLMALGRENARHREEPFCMTVLGLNMARARNGVSNLHGRVSRAMWAHLWPSRGVDEVPIGHVTNGIHLPSWIATPMARLYQRHLGNDWAHRVDDPRTWEAVARIDPAELWQQHEILRSKLVGFVRKRVRAQMAARGEADPGETAPLLDRRALTIGFARRFATYKRGDLLLRDLDRLAALVGDPERPVQIVFAGKAHPRDDGGKRIIQRVFEITRDARFRGRIVFLENHDMNVARHLKQGVDLWLNTPRRPLEASGTSGQKVVANGGLNCSILDGWWAEAYDGFNGFAIGDGGEHVDDETQNARDAESLFEVLENQVVPLFYDRNHEDVPLGWVARQKHAIQTLAWRFSARRMLLDYALGCYLPAAGARTSSFPARSGSTE